MIAIYSFFILKFTLMRYHIVSFYWKKRNNMVSLLYQSRYCIFYCPFHCVRDCIISKNIVTYKMPFIPSFYIISFHCVFTVRYCIIIDYLFISPIHTWAQYFFPWCSEVLLHVKRRELWCHSKWKESNRPTI